MIINAYVTMQLLPKDAVPAFVAASAGPHEQRRIRQIEGVPKLAEVATFDLGQVHCLGVLFSHGRPSVRRCPSIASCSFSSVSGCSRRRGMNILHTYLHLSRSYIR